MSQDPRKELQQARKEAGRINMGEYSKLTDTPLPQYSAPSTTKASKPAVSKSKLKTIRTMSGRANMPALAAWQKEQEKKRTRKRVTTKR